MKIIILLRNNHSFINFFFCIPLDENSSGNVLLKLFGHLNHHQLEECLYLEV